ncbi:MAG: LamG-like jellyroll fold domain-containing protein [Turneriella sp.]
MKLDKDSNCLNDKAACFKADKTPPQLAVNGAISPTQGQVISVLSTVDLMFSEELNNPQPADFVFSGAADITVNSIQKLNNYTYRLILTQNSLTSGNIYLNFSNLKDYNGNKITGNTTVSYVGNIDIPVTIPKIDANGNAIVNPSHDGLSGGAGYNAIDVFWYYSYVPPAANPGTTVYSVKVTAGSTDCKDASATTISTWNTAPTPAVGTVATYNNTDATTRAATTNKFTLKTTEITSTGAKTVLICVDNNTNNKHGVGVINIVRDDTAPVAPLNVTLSPPAGNYPTAQNLTFTCSDNSDRIIYTLSSNVGQPSDPAAPADPGFTGGVVDVGSTLYDQANPPATPYSGNTTRTIFKYRCIDKAGNVSAVVTSGAYRVNDSYPTVNFTSLVKTGTSVPIAGLSTGGYTSATINWSSNQVSQAWQLRTDALDCSAVGTVVTSGTTPAVANQNVSTVITPASTNITAAGNYVLRICVTNGTDWAQAYFNLLRDDGPLAAPTVNIAAGNYGAEQNLVFSCNANTDKIAYIQAAQAGASAPALAVNPDFTADGLLDTSIVGNALFSGPLTAKDGFTSIYRAVCIDKAGNKSTVFSSGAYTIDSILPTITIDANVRDVLSNVAGYTTTTLTWHSSRGGLPYDIRKGSTDCSEGSPAILNSPSLVSGTTPADTNQAITSTFDVANFGVEGQTSILICVKNLINRWGYTAKTITRDTVPPVMPGNLAVSASMVDATNFTFSWTAATDATSGVAGYRIYRTLVSNNYTNYPATWDYTATSSPATLAMPDAQRYFMRIVPFDAGGNVPTSAPFYYNEGVSKPAITLTLKSDSNGTNFNLSDGVTSALLTAGTVATSVPWSTSLGAGAVYNFSITNQPAGKVCAVHEKQFGTLTADLTINITCTSGYMVGQNFNAVPGRKLGYRLFQGKNTAIAGTANTPGFTNSTLTYPEYVAHLNGFLYVSDTNNYAIRKIDLSGNTLTTVTGTGANGNGTAADDADGTCAMAKFGQPMGITTDGVNLYVSEINFGRIRKISDVNGTCRVSILAGTGGAGFADGAPGVAQFNNLRQIVANNDYIYAADTVNNRIRRISLSTGTVDTLVGNNNPGMIDSNGTGTSANIQAPTGLILIGNTLYASTGLNHIMSIDINTRVATIVAGDGTAGSADAAGLSSRFNGILSMTTDGVDIYVAEISNHLIRRVEVSKNFRVTTLAGSAGNAADVTGAIGINARFNVPHGIASDGRSFFIANHSSHTIRKLTDNGLVGYWPLVGDALDYASDVTTPQSGTVNGSPATTATDRFGNTGYYAFDGLDDYISMSGANLPTGNAARTVCAWIKIDDVTNAGNDGVVTYGVRGSNTVFGLRLGSATEVSSWGGSNDVGFNVPLPVSNWTHACVTHNATVSKVYQNGHLLNQVTTAYSTGAGNLCIGERSGASGGAGCDVPGNFFFKGAITDVRVYNRALNEGEINELAQDAGGTAYVGNSFNTGATGLLVHYDFSNSIQPSGPIGTSLSQGGAPTTVTGKDGDANGGKNFSSSYHYFLSDQGLPKSAAPRTLCTWVKPARYPANTTYSGIFHYGANSTNQKSGLHLYTDGAGTKQIVFLGKNNDHVVNYALPLNAWSHVCGTFDGTNAQIYVNGAAMGAAGNFSAWNTGSGPVGIGRDLDGAPEYFDGTIDDVRIYNNALSAIQIRQLATQVPSGLLRRFDLSDDSAGGKALDVAGWGENASIAGATQAGDRFQQVNQSYSFNGSAQSISGADIGLPTNTSPRTLCSWIRPTAYPSTFGVIVKYGVGAAARLDALALQSSTGIAHAGYSADQIVSYKVPLNTWTHICGTFYSNAGTPTSEIFVNGASLGVDTTAGTIGSWGTTLTGGSTLNIGQPDYDANQRFNGDIDDVHIYNRVLSVAEVRALAGYHPMQVSSWSSNVVTSSLKLHYLPETLSTLNNNDQIPQWDDSSGSFMHLSQSTAADQPQYSAAGINNRPAVNFNSNRHFTRSCNANLNSNATSIFGVMNQTNTSGGFRGLFHHGDKLLYFNGSTNEQFAWFQTGVDAPRVISLNNYITLVSGGPNMVFGFTYDGSSGSIFKNSQNVSAASSATGGFSCATGLTFGKPTWVGDNFNGLIGDFLYFNTSLNAADRLVTECYLSAKYSIPLAAGVVCP